MTEAERYAETDEIGAHAQRFAPIHSSIPDLPTPSHLASAVVPRRNLCAEFSALSQEELLAEAEIALERLSRAGRPTDHAVIVALIRLVRRKASLDGAIWLDFGATV